MPSKMEFYSQMAEDKERELTANYQNWTAFLAAAARMYKYPYHDQLMIYAQRPNAAACAEYDIWTRRMGRYVRRGSTLSSVWKTKALLSSFCGRIREIQGFWIGWMRIRQIQKILCRMR